jgi:hypothetical protein
VNAGNVQIHLGGILHHSILKAPLAVPSATAGAPLGRDYSPAMISRKRRTTPFGHLDISSGLLRREVTQGYRTLPVPFFVWFPHDLIISSNVSLGGDSLQFVVCVY